ncbi:PQQ-dependent dehydrogenase, methanol/ethanol family [Aequoribacter fuscus]|nr:PQQ-dependent dehydrogenase, methanol/ethanol family [Aequoribacter fuscus]QHJ87401.1 PQQ-dependent dehydrogenase, methanol/ethanol family [Aequoribacter fuscus]
MNTHRLSPSITRAFAIGLTSFLVACSSSKPPVAEVPAVPANVTKARVIAADQEPGNWMAHGRTYSEQRYSPLSKINAENVKNLGMAWHYDLGDTRGIEATPIVVDGVMYVTGGWSKVFALDAKTGEEIWTYDPKMDKAWFVNMCCDAVNRGATAWEGKIYSGVGDGRLIAIDAATGELVWEVQTTPKDRPYSITGAPRVVDGKVIIGNGGSELGVRGFVTAYDANTGEQVWRFYTVPGNPNEPFENAIHEQTVKTWSGEWWTVGGGGTAWDSIAHDPELNLVYIGVGNGAPWNRMYRSNGTGDNLFLSSIVALNAETGEYVWHYQTTPGESWDYTATQHMILADMEFDGRMRKVIMQAPKNGFFYVIDRETGEFISAEKYTMATWATHVDPESGRPVEAPEARYEETGVPNFQFPHPLGGHNWHPMSYSPDTGLVYIPAQEIPIVYGHDSDYEYNSKGWNVGVRFELAASPDDPAVRAQLGAMVKGYITAWDPVTQTEKWRVQHPNMWNGGLLSTAGNLVFQGNAEGEFVAYTADSGERLWSSYAQTGVVAGPVTYTVDGEQYVAVAAGWGGSFAMVGGELAKRSKGSTARPRVLVYKLGGTHELPPEPTPEQMAVVTPIEQIGDEAMITEGLKQYMANCHMCHGDRAVSGSSVPDLRMMSEASWELFYPIVQGGLRHQQGMVGFGDRLNKDQIDSIYAYLVKRRNDLAAGID